MLSVIVITKNEAKHIELCLKSVMWADEIIIFDSGSTDNTVNICKQFTQHIYETDWPGFGPQKQRALNKATGHWVMSIDADEQITDALKLEIQHAIKQDHIHGFEIPRLSSYCGHQMKHGGWWPDYVLRLFQRNAGKFSQDIVHEQILVKGNVSKFQNYLLHDTYENLDEVLQKINSYSSLGAKKLFEKNKVSSLRTAILRGLWMFFRTYIIKAAFLDGSKGLMLAISNAETTYYKYLKLFELQNKNKITQTPISN